MKQDNNVNEKNNVITDYRFTEKFIYTKFGYTLNRIGEFYVPFVGGFIHASIPDFPAATTDFAFFGTILGVAPTLLKYAFNGLTLKCKKIFKKDIGMMGCGDSGTALESGLEKLDQDKREKAFNHVKNFVESDKSELSDYLGREVNQSAFRGVISYAAGVCFKKMFF